MTGARTQSSVVFLPGWLGDPTEWQDVICKLNDWNSEGWGLVGRSDWQSTIDQLVKQLPLHAILVGYSLGARMALGCALHPQSRLDGLVLLSGNAGLENEFDRASRWQHDQTIAQRLREMPLNGFLEDWYNQPVFASVSRGVRQNWIHSRASIDREHQARLLEILSVASQPNYWPKLPEVTIPTLVLAGALDDKFVSIAQRMHAAIPRSELRILPDVGHAAHREQSQQLADCLDRWLRTQDLSPWKTK